MIKFKYYIQHPDDDGSPSRLLERAVGFTPIVGQINSSCHRRNIAQCALAQVAAMGSANSLHLTNIKTSIMKFDLSLFKRDFLLVIVVELNTCT